ncbi:hypothetical protein PanWU01x14_037640 [Parasponia andersonii]|uniref:Uncharacterized protein n=1 Tax=Parasponia andersonii TaxID=3476 RepID=A0A2P5DRZ0_PARAD|nr:hypothetical protein PanWU01x14_037640 [Parasponia andersonii]
MSSCVKSDQLLLGLNQKLLTLVATPKVAKHLAPDSNPSEVVKALFISPKLT